MPTKYAALVWDRVLYLDSSTSQQIYDFYLRYAERSTDDGQWIAPPEPQCNPPSPSRGSASAVGRGEPSASAGRQPVGAPPARAPASPAVEPSPSPSAS